MHWKRLNWVALRKPKPFYLVTAIGADAKSPFFYSRVKGELEVKLRQLEYDSLIDIPAFIIDW